MEITDRIKIYKKKNDLNSFKCEIFPFTICAIYQGTEYVQPWYFSKLSVFSINPNIILSEI